MTGQPAQAIASGIFLLLVGGGIWGLGNFLNNGIAALTGLVLFAGGVVLFFTGIASFFDKLKI